MWRLNDILSGKCFLDDESVADAKAAVARYQCMSLESCARNGEASADGVFAALCAAHDAQQFKGHFIRRRVQDALGGYKALKVGGGSSGGGCSSRGTGTSMRG